MSTRKLVKPHSLVVITWLDAHFDLDNETECQPMLTCGWVVKHTKTQISVASEKSQSSDYMRAHTSIPAGMVLSIAVLATP